MLFVEKKNSIISIMNLLDMIEGGLVFHYLSNTLECQLHDEEEDEGAETPAAEKHC